MAGWRTGGGRLGVLIRGSGRADQEGWRTGGGLIRGGGGWIDSLDNFCQDPLTPCHPTDNVIKGHLRRGALGAAIDITDNELAKTHLQHTAGGRRCPPSGKPTNERTLAFFGGG